MSFNGSGTFVINSAGQPVVANTVISATVFNSLTSDLATGLSTCITKDGQTTVTANIPFGSNKITGLGSGTAATDAANLGQVQSTAAKLITVTGTDTITGTMSPALTAYAAGQLFYFIANGANTGAMTINVDGLGAKAITRDGATALIAGDVQSGEIIVICYDGTRFQMINAANSFGNTTINGTLTVTGNTALQANVSITSTLSVGGTFAVTGAATLGSTLAVTGKSDLPTVSTASMNAAVAVITTGTVTALTATGASIASMNAGVALLTTATVTNFTATGASIASANIGNLQFTAASIASINAGVAVITSLTATGASIASMNAGVALLTTATVTNLTATGASIASANAGNLQVTGASVASANFGNVVTTTERVTNFSATSASIASANAAVALITTGTVTNLTSTSASIASANIAVALVTTGTVTNLTATGASIASANIGNLLATSLTVSSGSTLNGGVVINEPGADVDFRVEGDTDANLLFVDASTDRIGIGTNTPATKLDVNGTIYAAAVYAQTIASVSSFSWNTATSSPAASSTNPYGGGAPVVTNIHRNMRRCLLADDGTVNYYLDESDSTLKADGSAAVLTGADGMVMVEIPAFYVKREVSGSVITWSVSDVPLSGFDLHPAFYKDGKDVKYRYYSAYDACVNTTGSTYQSGLNWDNNVGAGNGQAWNTATAKLASVSGIYPAVGITRADARAMAANRGTGWRQLDYTLLAAVQLLYLIEYQTFYSQNNTGGGNTATTYAASSGTQADNGASEAGKSNSIGNASTNTTNGASSASRQVAWMSYRGIENFYGNAWNWADGVIVNAAGSVSADSATWHFTNNSADFSDTVSTNMTLITSSGQTNFDYPDALASVNNFFISTSGGGSSTTYTTDYWYGSTSADRVVGVSGGADLGAAAGAFVVSAGEDASSRARSIGARLAF